MEKGLIDLKEQPRETLLMLFAEAQRMIPISDLASLRQEVGKRDYLAAKGYISDDVKLREALASLRWQNPICDGCYTKEKKLLLCPACKLTFYCSLECQAKHSEVHADRCCKLDGPLDDGPQRLVLLPIKEKSKEEPLPETIDGCWKLLINLSASFQKNRTNDIAQYIVQTASQIFVKMSKEHGVKLSDIERGLRERNLLIWLFAANPVPQYECRQLKNHEKKAPYAMSVSVGSRQFFEDHDLKFLSRTYEENFDILDECGIYMIIPS